MSNDSIQVAFDTERSGSTSDNAFHTLGSALTVNPVIVVFDNQTTAAVQISVDGTNTWKTFSAGEALVLDLRANHGIASNFSIPLGTQFYYKSTGATGNMLISILYAR